MKKLLFTFYFLLFTCQFATSQNIGIGTNTPDPSAQLEVSSTNRGFLLPRMTFVQRNSISNPATGLMVYCTDCGANGAYQVYNGKNWTDMNLGPAKPALPKLSTTSVISVTETTATSGGNVTSDGGGTVIVRGVVWSNSPNPTVALATKTSNGSGTGIFTSNITGLTAGTTYYVRAYATNSTGTAYGNEVSFVFQPVVADIDGNTYPFVVIGTQTWMTENLRTTKYRDGSNIPVVTSNTQWSSNNQNGTTLPMMCWYNNDQATYTFNKFGALYNWYAINTATNGNKNVCPTGWHVPSDGEWTILTNFLGGELVAGGKMKTTGTQYWPSPNVDATNSSGFSGLPGGYRSFNGLFDGNNSAAWWSSTVNSAIDSDSWCRFLRNFYGAVSRFNSVMYYGYSVRCVKD